jgi:hypothetical protein
LEREGILLLAEATWLSVSLGLYALGASVGFPGTYEVSRKPIKASALKADNENHQYSWRQT